MTAETQLATGRAQLGHHISLSRVQPARRAQRKTLLADLADALKVQAFQTPIVMDRIEVCAVDMPTHVCTCA